MLVDTIKPLSKIKQSKEYGYNTYHIKLSHAYENYLHCRSTGLYGNAKIYFKYVTKFYWLLYSGRGVYKLK
jgi:hypothetical protein